MAKWGNGPKPNFGRGVGFSLLPYAMSIPWYIMIYHEYIMIYHDIPSRLASSRLVTVAGSLPVGTMSWLVSSRLVTSRGLTSHDIVPTGSEPATVTSREP